LSLALKLGLKTPSFITWKNIEKLRSLLAEFQTAYSGN
jgi:hypothetical protein